MPTEVRYSHGATDDACTDDTHCDSPRRAGVGIFRNGSNCTTGFAVTKSGDRRILTAGHCWYSNTSGSVTTASGVGFGTLEGGSFMASGWDVRLVQTPNSDTPNWLYYSNTDKSHAVTVVTTALVQDHQVRVNGANTRSNGVSQVTDYSYVSSTCGCTIRWAYLADYASSGGDSGAAVTTYSGTTARGIHSGRSSGYGRFQGAYEFVQAWGGAVLTSN